MLATLTIQPNFLSFSSNTRWYTLLIYAFLWLLNFNRRQLEKCILPEWFIWEILIIDVYEKTLTFSCSWRRYACSINCFRSSSDINGSLDGFPDPLFCSFTIILVFSLLPTKSFIFLPGKNSFPENHSWANCTSITCNKYMLFQVSMEMSPISNVLNSFKSLSAKHFLRFVLTHCSHLELWRQKRENT